MNDIKRQILWNTICSRCLHGWRKKPSRVFCMNGHVDTHGTTNYKVEVCRGKYFERR